MTSSATSLSTSFNAYLFAMSARLDLDPWAEAADLARVPAAGAAERLSSLLAGVADGRDDALSDRGTIAARLIGPLPADVTSNIMPGAGAAVPLASPFAQNLGIMWMIIMASMAVRAWVAPAAAGATRTTASKPFLLWPRTTERARPVLSAQDDVARTAPRLHSRRTAK